MAMIVAHPTTFAAIIAERPTEPAPKTAMLDPAPGFSAFITAPAPVCTPHSHDLNRNILGDLDDVAFGCDRIF
jgi:hypothetical protein